MIIKKLTMHNFGVYAGTNTFDFNQRKPIVLIGGMNGRGKTTFLEAILLSLYGTNSFAYKESTYRSYGQYLRSYVNKSDGSNLCYIELEFGMDQEDKEIYLVHREWNATNIRTHEKIKVYKNDTESDFLTKNWAMFVENMLPSALSNFFFFDGEKIAELAVDNTDHQMKESIRSMLGITTLDVLKNDLFRLLRKTNKNVESTGSIVELQRLRKEKDKAVEDLTKLDFQIEDLSNQKQQLKISLEQLQHDYEAKGGDVVDERQKLMEKKSNLMAESLKIKDKLIEIAAGEMPLLLVTDLLNNIKEQAEEEHSANVMHAAMNELEKIYIEYSKLNQEYNKYNQEFMNYVREKTGEKTGETVYGLSDHALLQLQQLKDSKFKNNITARIKYISEKQQLKTKIEEIDSYLSLDINEKELNDIFKEIRKCEEELKNIEIELGMLKQSRSGYNSDVLVKTAAFNKYVESYLLDVEVKDDSERKIKYINLALQILDKYTKALQERKTDNLALTITSCYKKLANKKNLIEKIKMDSETLDISYINERGEYVPKDSLSAGEKQLMVIAILWALAICSKKKLPVIIDTPLSRLDSQHRTAIISTYFPNASDQTIILSTDTEIDRTYYNLIKNDVGDEFTLKYCESTKSTTILRGYFQEEL